ncbi:MAG: hypothetical protein FJZ49_00740 [Candidatus Verstraetearchaeota archaeon]|nr:hypothetical protein [Candidatus Verstraetearchaeota archaeon]
MSVVSVKVPKRVKEDMEKLKDRVSWPEEIRSFIAKKLEEAKNRETVEQVEELLGTMPVQPKGTVSMLVREDRGSH